MTELFSVPLSKLGFESTAELITHPEPDYVVKGLLTQDSVAVLYGPPGTGKSLLMLDLMLHIAMGMPWVDHPTERGTVVYLYGEGAGGMAKRVNLWLNEHGVAPEDPAVIFGKSILNLADDEAVTTFIQRMTLLAANARFPLRLVVFDTLARSILGVDESSNKEMGKVVANAERIRDQLGVAVMLVHHTGKDQSKGMRGASALLGAIETSFSVKKDGTTGLFMEVEKQKDGPDGEVFRFTKEALSLPDGRQSCLVRFDGLATATEAAVNDNQPALSQAQQAMVGIIETLDSDEQGAPWEDVRKALKDLGIGGNRSSGLADIKKALLEKAVIRQFGDRLFLCAG